MSKEADLAYLKAMLTEFVVNDDDSVIRTKIRLTATMIKALRNSDGQIGVIVREMNPELQEKFIEGYEKAISRYGISVGNYRMKEFLINLILQYEPYRTREDIIALVIKGDTMASLSVKMMKNGGIYLEKDEDGNYKEV